KNSFRNLDRLLCIFNARELTTQSKLPNLGLLCDVLEIFENNTYILVNLNAKKQLARAVLYVKLD
ncbi:hypothetical protein HQ571_03285, partial [Candidatus Kuenenbacteria bacterium]|nr:hypothetical protein [Candidatus Kuenenbacteria bacterium]